MTMIPPPTSETELLVNCQAIEGLSFGQLAFQLGLTVSDNPLKRKGWIGQAIERMLGANSGSLQRPDFEKLGIELKTLPINHMGKPSESTFVTTIPLLTVHKQRWLTSQCFVKLKRVLWLLVEGDTTIPFVHRRIGPGILWSPSVQENKILEADWLELTSMIGMGRLTELHAGVGQYLQVRPKAANAKSLCYGFDEEGNKILTLPRGFYLRPSFTGLLL